MKKEIENRIKRQCVVCGKTINTIVYKDRTLRGGHYFGKVPFYYKKDLEEMSKSGTRKVKIGEHEFDVFKKDPKPYKHEEYWECPKCYWRK